MPAPERRDLPRAVAAFLSTLRSGKTPPEKLGVILGRLRQECRRRGLELRTSPQPGLPPCMIWIVKRGIPQRLRRVARRSATTRTYRFLSLKSGQFIECEGDYEHELGRRHEVDPTVATFFEQTPALLYLLDGTVHLYTPDFVAAGVDGSLTIYEVKPVRHVERRYMPSHRSRRFGELPKTAKKADPARQEAEETSRLGLVAEGFKELGLGFCIVRADALTAEPEKSTFDALYRHRSNRLPAPLRLDVCEYIRQHPNSTVRDLMTNLDLTDSQIFSLVACGDIRVDLAQPFDDGALVSPGMAAS